MKKITALLFTVLIIFGAAGCSILDDEAALAPTVSGFNYQAAADETVTVSWDAYDGASYYTVQLGASGVEGSAIYDTTSTVSVGRQASDGNGTVDYAVIVRAYDEFDELLSTFAEVIYTSYEEYGTWSRNYSNDGGTTYETAKARFWSNGLFQQWTYYDSDNSWKNGWRGSWVDDGVDTVTVTASAQWNATDLWAGAITYNDYTYTYYSPYTSLIDAGQNTGSTLTLNVKDSTDLLRAMGGQTAVKMVRK